MRKSGLRELWKDMLLRPCRVKPAELCLAAVTLNGWALTHVPDSLRTPEPRYAAIYILTLALPGGGTRDVYFDISRLMAAPWKGRTVFYEN